MAEDAYRAELRHKWAMRRLNEAITAVQRARAVLEQDIAYIRAQNQSRRTK